MLQKFPITKTADFSCAGGTPVVASVVMAPKKKSPKGYTQKQLAEIARSLRVIAERVEYAASSMQSEKIGTLDVTSWRSGEIAIKHWQSFSRSVHSAVDVAILTRAIDD